MNVYRFSFKCIGDESDMEYTTGMTIDIHQDASSIAMVRALAILMIGMSYSQTSINNAMVEYLEEQGHHSDG